MNEIALSISRVLCCAAPTERGRPRPRPHSICGRMAGRSRSCSMFVLLVAAAALTGCARFEPKPLSSADTAARLENRFLTNAELRAFVQQNLHREVADWPPVNWDFEMLTLAALY